MASRSLPPQTSRRPNIAERIAIDPFLPKNDLINEFIRNTINPDIDASQTYYTGIIVDIIDKDNKEVDC